MKEELPSNYRQLVFIRGKNLTANNPSALGKWAIVNEARQAKKPTAIRAGVVECPAGGEGMPPPHP